LRNFSKALVTGSAGFIVSHPVDMLLSEGFEVTVLDAFSSARKAEELMGFQPKIELEDGLRRLVELHLQERRL